jgi:Ca2+-binding RTX toxin-like protein
MVKTALGIKQAVDLRTFDAWAKLSSTPSDATALAVERVALQVAVLTSAGGDQTGMTLAQKIVSAFKAKTVIHLSDTAFVTAFVGPSASSTLLHEIIDRNSNISELSSISDLQSEWQNFQSGLGTPLSPSIADLSIHINQAPTGTATASLQTLQGVHLDINPTALLAGFSDSDGGVLQVSDLHLDQGGSVSLNAATGHWTFTPAAGFTGPVELGFNVLDGQGATVVASVMLVVSPQINFTGTAGADTLTGNAIGNNLKGLAGNDTLSGLGGNDTLDGGTGADAMTGGDGSDIYYVDNTADKVTETNATASTGGTDTVYSTLATYTLGANVENGIINTSAAANLTGNALANVLYAGAGNNVLDGGAGIDTASYQYASAAVTVSLASIAAQATGGSGSDTLKNIENLTGSAYADKLTGSAANNALSGGAGNDSVNGGAGNDVISGDAGNDVLAGELGADKLTGGAGADHFDFNGLAELGLTSTTWDTITDFKTTEADKIDLQGVDANTALAGDQAFSYLGMVAAFTGDATGKLRFDATAHILYGSTDADTAAEFAIVLTGVSSLSATDFVL